MKKINIVTIFLLCSVIQILGSDNKQIHYQEIDRLEQQIKDIRKIALQREFDRIIANHPDSECCQKCVLARRECAVACCESICAISWFTALTYCAHDEVNLNEAFSFGGKVGLSFAPLFFVQEAPTALDKITKFDEYKKTRPTQELQKMK